MMEVFSVINLGASLVCFFVAMSCKHDGATDKAAFSMAFAAVLSVWGHS